MELRYIKFTNVADSSIANYEARLRKLLEICHPKSLKDILKHPSVIYPIIAKHTNNKCTTIANYATLISKIYSSNPEIAEKYPKAQKQWKHYLYKCRNEQNSIYSENKASQEKLAQVVTMEDIKTRHLELSSKGPKNKKEALNLVLLSCFIHLVPKRADLGNVRIYFNAPPDPAPKDINYIVLAKEGSVLQINKFKTAKHVKNGITEGVAKQLYDDIMMSLQVHPREFLFTNIKGEPYTKNNSYSQFVKRAFLSMFGKPMGVSLWRHVYVSTEMDLHRMSDREIQERVRKMGTSEQQLKHVYKWINMDAKSPTQICETKCRPI